MQVVSYGHMKPKELTCRGCGAVLAYTIRDVKVRVQHEDRIVYVTCPVCGRHNGVDDLEE